MLPSSSSQPTNSGVGATHRPILEDEEAGPSCSHSIISNRDSLVGTENVYLQQNAVPTPNRGKRAVRLNEDSEDRTNNKKRKGSNGGTVRKIGTSSDEAAAVPTKSSQEYEQS